jgi:hypothetical protein
VVRKGEWAVFPENAKADFLCGSAGLRDRPYRGRAGFGRMSFTPNFPKRGTLNLLFPAMDKSLHLLIADARRPELTIWGGKTREHEIIINTFFDYSRILSRAVLFLFNYRRHFGHPS